MSKEEQCESAEDQSPGIFSWREMISQDVDGSREFYTKLLGWEVESVDMGEGGSYEMFVQQGRPVAGLYQAPVPDIPTMWFDYITVEDLDATLEKAQGLGAQVTMPATAIPEKGRFGCVLDPQGAAIGFWQFL